MVFFSQGRQRKQAFLVDKPAAYAVVDVCLRFGLSVSIERVIHLARIGFRLGSIA